MEKNFSAEVISVMPNKIVISVRDLKDYSLSGEKLSVGSYLIVTDETNSGIVSVIENFRIDQKEEKNGGDGRIYILEALPLGFLDPNGNFERGGNRIAIPPSGARPAKKDEIIQIYGNVDPQKSFCFATLVNNIQIDIPVNGDQFFNKHVAIVGSTGSGKSHTVAKVIQEAVKAKNGNYIGLNNSHIVIFDIHSEYKTAFPSANYLDVDSLKIPYWLMNSEELEELFLESGDFNNYNQSSLLSEIVTRNKKKYLYGDSPKDKVEFDTPTYFSIDEVIRCLVNLSKETRNSKNIDEIAIVGKRETFSNIDEKYNFYFESEHSFEETQREKVSKGVFNDGSIDKFISRLKAKKNDRRLSFLFDTTAKDSFEELLCRILGYGSSEHNENSNITIIDLSGVPFEVLSITVSLISRLLFDYSFHFKKTMSESETKTPVVVVYEEAHKYVPKVDSSKFKAARLAIERIAKEGRKYGISSIIVSQRPSEISETIFAQCSNFLAMRLTNPVDQNYVSRLLPDTLGALTDTLPTLQAGEALLIGDSVIMPSKVKIKPCEDEPSSSDIPYLQEWKKPWYDVDFTSIIDRWTKK